MTGLRKLMGEWENDRAERQELSAADREELNALIDEERNEYWARHCPAHGSVLDSLGGCAVCEQEYMAELAEERRRDL